MQKLPILLSIPHGGIDIPSEVSNRIKLTPLERLIDSDTRTRQLFDLSESVSACVETPIARSIIDVNRDYRNDWCNVFKSHSRNGKPVWKKGMYPTQLERQILLDRYYHPYHQRLTSFLKEKGIRLAVDAHAMIAKKHIDNSAERQTRPLFCISNRGSKDPRFPEKNLTAPFWIMKILKKNLEDVFSKILLFEIEDVVKINDPFRGGYITAFHGKKPEVPFIQLEVNRTLYLPPEKHLRMYMSADEIKQMDIVRTGIYEVFSRTIAKI